MTKYEGLYKCKWPGCHYEFSAQFGKIENSPGKVSGGGCCVVKCPKCGNNVKPISEAISLKEIQEKTGGVQHG